MNTPESKSAQERKIGKHQVDEQQATILEAAEQLFLQKGIENTSIGDIARQAGITRVTLYRYFANRDEIAVKIQARMFRKINSLLPTEEPPSSIEDYRQRVQIILRNFSQLREAYRYIGLFDKFYLDQAADSDLAQWTLAQIRAGIRDESGKEPSFAHPHPYHHEMTVIFSTITWFLEKLALRGELTWSDQDIPLEQHLQVFEAMVTGYLDRLAAAGLENHPKNG